MTAATGEAAFVVQEPFEVILHTLNSSSFTPRRIVFWSGPSSSLAGAVMTTRFAPAARCTLAFS